MRLGSRILAPVCAGFCCGLIPGQQRARGSLIAGTVVDQNTGGAISKATVRLTLVEASGAFSNGSYAIDISDSGGRFGFSYLPPGRYRLSARKDGYEGGQYGGRRPGDPGVVLILGANDQRWQVVLHLAKTGVISGVVRDSDGNPLDNVRMLLFKPQWLRGKRQLQDVRQAMTDDRGQYRMPYLMPGEYILEAHPYARRQFIVNPGGVTTQPPAKAMPLFYPNAVSARDATPIAVEAGKEASGMDMVLREERAAVLTGKVSLPDGVEVNTFVQLWAGRKDSIEGMFQGQNFTGAPSGGVYRFADLEPGAYRVVATASAGGKQYRGMVDVDVGEGEAEASIVLSGGLDVHGSVKLEGGAQTGSFNVTLVAGDTQVPGASTPPAKTGADSSFVIKDVLPGLWDINVSPIPEGGYLKSMMLGSQDVLTEDMWIRPDTTAALNIVVSTRGAKVEGDVNVGGRGGPQQAIVLLAPVGKFSRVMSFFRSRIADEKGHFVIPGVRPGEYRVYALDEMAPRAFEDPEFLKPFESEGQSVTVGEGETVRCNPVLLHARSEP